MASILHGVTSIYISFSRNKYVTGFKRTSPSFSIEGHVWLALPRNFPAVVWRGWGIRSKWAGPARIGTAGWRTLWILGSSCCPSGARSTSPLNWRGSTAWSSANSNRRNAEWAEKHNVKFIHVFKRYVMRSFTKSYRVWTPGGVAPMGELSPTGASPRLPNFCIPCSTFCACGLIKACLRDEAPASMTGGERGDLYGPTSFSSSCRRDRSKAKDFFSLFTSSLLDCRGWSDCFLSNWNEQSDCKPYMPHTCICNVILLYMYN